jgi:hypothetical protein
MNNNQHNALFIPSLLCYHTSTCFGGISSLSSGGRMYIVGVPKKCIHILHYYFSKLNWITVAICSKTFAQKMAFMLQAGQSKKMAEAWLLFRPCKTITILIQFFFPFLKCVFFGTLCMWQIVLVILYRWPSVGLALLTVNSEGLRNYQSNVTTLTLMMDTGQVPVTKP